MAQFNAHFKSVATLNIVLTFFATLAVVLRFIARWKSNIGYGMDDWFALVSLIGMIIVISFIIWGGENGAGYEMATLPGPVLRTYLKSAYLVSVFVITPLSFARFSVLAFYNRIFSVHGRFRKGVRVIFLLNTFWWIACTVSLICFCIPPAAFWDPSIKGKCISDSKFTLWAEVPEIILDFIILSFPLSILRELRLPLRHKVALSLIFMAGSFVGVVGLVRVIVVYRPQDFSFNAGLFWITLQLGASVICCCLPTYRPLLPNSAIIGSLRTRFSSLLRRSNTRSGSNIELQNEPQLEQAKPAKYKRYINLRDDLLDSTILTQAAASSVKSVKGSEDLPINAIRVQRSVDMA